MKGLTPHWEQQKPEKPNEAHVIAGPQLAVAATHWLVDAGFDVGLRDVGLRDVGFDEVGFDVGFNVVGFDEVGFVVGLAVTWLDPAGFDDVGIDVGFELVGATEVGLAVTWLASVGFDDVGVDVGFKDVGIDEVVGAPDEHPAVLLTSATTASLHKPLVSCSATQKKAPPLHENCPLL